MIEAVAFVVVVTVTAIAAVLRAAGASLVRTPRADALHDAAEGDHRAELVAELLDDRLTLQPSVSMTHLALLVVATVVDTWALVRVADGVPLLVAIVASAILIVFVGDVLPRSFGRQHPRTLAYRFSRLLAIAIQIGGRAADLVAEIEEGEQDEEEEDEDDAAEKELISSILEFSETLVREVMVPRPDMVTIPAGADTDAALDLVLAEGRSRVPVTGDSIDDIAGILYARDLLKLFDDGQGPRPCSDLARAPYFVPETKRVAELMREMQANQVHLAIVVDEFGTTAGLVTIEDLLEEIVGEIVDEYDREEPLARQLREGEWLLDARMDIDAAGELIGVDLPDEEWDTVGGLLLGLAGRVPREGERFELGELLLTADRVQGRRIARVRVTGAVSPTL